MKSTIEYCANGKLLLTGEYLVLTGAKALAMPVKFGQKISVVPDGSGLIKWESIAPAGSWFHASYEPATLHILSYDRWKTAVELKRLLSAARKLNKNFLTGPEGFRVTVTANYPLEWGMGSSATLCALVASWAEVDVFDLFWMISKGSGYDIACTNRKELIYYQVRKGRPEISEAFAGSALQDHSWFAYLGHKQSTTREIDAFLVSQNFSSIDLAEVTRLSEAICPENSVDELIRLIDEHEFILSTILKRDPISRQFPSFPGTVKSLGAWGGDYAMFISGETPSEIKRTITALGLNPVFSFNDLRISS